MHIPRWLWVLTIIAILAVVLYGVVIAGGIFSAKPPPDSIVCTADALQCPDGSYVGRTGPRCEFVCPGTAVLASTTVEARIGKSATALGVGILPLELKEDSRCPVDAECIWAGTVRVSTRIHSAMGDSEMIFTLDTPITTEAEKITLIEVRPAPVVEVKIAPAQYIFVFKIEKRG